MASKPLVARAAPASRRPVRATAPPVVRAAASGAPPPPPAAHRRQLLGAALAAAVAQSPLGARASGLESIEMFDIPKRTEEELAAIQENSRSKLKEADDTFENSELLASLKAKSEANKAKNAKDLSTKYCMRQAELGIGDCGGLRYIPGATKNGKQKTPKWLQKVLGVEMEQPDVKIKF